MSLLDIVKKAQSLNADHLPNVASFPLEPAWLISEAQESEELNQSPLPAESNDLVSWRPLPAVDDSVKLRLEEEERLVASLNHALEGSNTLSASDLDKLLRSYLKRISGESDGARVLGKTGAKVVSLIKLLKISSSLLGQRLLSAILRACVVTSYWDGVQAMLDSKSVAGNTYPNLISTLVESCQVSLICLWITNVRDPRFPDLLAVLRFFLESSQRASKPFVFICQQWRQRALDMIAKLAAMRVGKVIHGDEDESGDINEMENVSPRSGHSSRKDPKKGIASTAILLAAAVDQFQPNEVCLHYLIASGQDEAVLASILSQLDTNEVLRLLRYLEKWLKKYASQSISSNFATRRRHLWIPSLEQIIQWMAVVLDVHYTTVILCPDFHTNLQSIQLLVNGLVDLSHKFAPLLGIIEHIRNKGLLPVHGSFTGDEDHVIEYLEI